MTIRPVHFGDAQLLQEFVKALSPNMRYLRFMSSLRELSPEMVAHFTRLDYAREMALIAVVRERGRERQIGVARYSAHPNGESCEMAIVVADDWQRCGLSRRLLRERLRMRALIENVNCVTRVQCIRQRVFSAPPRKHSAEQHDSS